MPRDSKAVLVEYIKRNLKKGYTEESLKWALIKQGYSRAIVESSIEGVHKELSELAPIVKEKPRIKHEIFDENNKPIEIKNSFWRRLLG